MSFPSTDQDRVITKAIEERASALIVAGPGAGKSRCALEIATRLLEKTKPEKKVLFLSFSNAAIRRLSSASAIGVKGRDSRRRLMFATYHSLAAEVLSNYGQFVGIRNKAKVIDNLEESFVAIASGWGDLNKQDYRKAVLTHAKTTGELTFGTLIPLATSLLVASPKLREIYFRCFELIIVDEFQDTSREQWNLLKAIGQHKQVLAFGDPNQIIYASLHEATSERLREFEEWKNVSQFNLPTLSHRCKEEDILSFATCLLQGKEYSLPSGESPVKIVQMYSNQLFARLAAYCIKFLASDKKSWNVGILVPRNRMADEIVYNLRNPDPDAKVAKPVFAQMPQNRIAVEALQFAVAALLDQEAMENTKTLRATAIALCAMNKLWNAQAGTSEQNVREIEKCFTSARMKKNRLAELPGKVRSAGTSMKERVEAMLGAIADNSIFSAAVRRIYQNFPNRIPDPLVQSPGSSVFEDLRKVRKAVGLYGEEISNGRIQVLTYQKSKGREFDVVIMVVDKYAETADSAIEERRRLYYVSATRAKNRLFVIHFGEARLGNVLGPVLAPT